MKLSNSSYRFNNTYETLLSIILIISLNLLSILNISSFLTPAYKHNALVLPTNLFSHIKQYFP